MEQTKTNYFSDARNWAKTTTGIALIGLLGFATFVYLLPILLSIVWGTVQLAIGGIILATLLNVLTSKGTWRRIGYINAKIAKLLTFWIIAWDEFLIQENAIQKAKKDRNIIKEQGDILFGQVAEKNYELEDNQKKLEESEAIIIELQREGRPSDDAELQLAANEYTRCKDFKESITPLRDQMNQLGQLCQKIYKDTGFKITDAERELNLQKSKLASLTAGETAMNKALSIFTAENPDVQLAEKLIKEKIGKKIGSIRNTLDIINPIMSERALKDKVKVSLALKQLNVVSLELDNKEKVTYPVNLSNMEKKEEKYKNIFK